MEDVLTVDVHCNNVEPVPYYRLYLDQDLLTERDFSYDINSQFIRERCVVRLTEGEHKIFVAGPYTTNFNVKNAVLNGEPIKLGTDGTFKK
jgi:hypothetical protein